MKEVQMMPDKSTEHVYMVLEESGNRVQQMFDLLKSKGFNVLRALFFSDEASENPEIRDILEAINRLNNTPPEQPQKADRGAEHAAICKELTELYTRKNHDYGDSFHITFEKWGLPMAAIRLGDKLQRFETLIKAESQIKSESIRDMLIDLANYAILTVMEMDRGRTND